MTSGHHHVQSTDQTDKYESEPFGYKVLVVQFPAPCIQVLPSILHTLFVFTTWLFDVVSFSRFADGMHKTAWNYMRFMPTLSCAKKKVVGHKTHE